MSLVIAHSSTQAVNWL